MTKETCHDLLEHAKWEMSVFERVSKSTSQQLINEIERLRGLLEDIHQDAKERDLR